MKKTKIICSIGPSTQNWDKFKGLVEAGMNVARINFSHATIEERNLDESLIKRANEELNAHIATLYDTKGPDLRTCSFENDKITIEAGKTIKIVDEDIIGTSEKISFNYRGILKDLERGMTILLDDGFYKLIVEEASETEVTCRIVNGGEISSRRGVCIPGVKLDVPYVSEQDKEDIKYACENNGDFLAISFVNCADDIRQVRELCKEYGKENMSIISKLETQYAMDNIDEIIDETDIVMVARGDLGTETGVENLPLYQQMIIDKCREKGKRVIMATQMMTSMKHNIRPTNAEVTDVANAVLLGCDAIMTSDETTMGEYPVETVQNMKRICENVESYSHIHNTYIPANVKDSTEIIAESVIKAVKTLNSKLIVAATMSGHSAKAISNLRPKAPILAPVPSEEVARSLALSYAVYPVVVNEYNSTEEVIEEGAKKAKEFMNLEKGDQIIITGGFPNKGNKNTNFMKIEEIQ